MRKSILSIAIIALAISSSHANNYQEQDCVRSFNTMNKYVKKTKLNAKADSSTSMKVNFSMAQYYAAEAIVDCEYVRPELSYKAQEVFDQLVSIQEMADQAVEDAKMEAELQREIAEAEAESAEEGRIHENNN